MKRGCRAGLLAATVTALAVISACTPTDPDPSATPAATTTSPSPSPADEPTTSTPSPTPTTDEEIAVARAEALVREYYAVTDQLGLDATADLGRLEDVAISQELAVQQQRFRDWRSAGWVQTGQTRIVEVVAQSVNLDNSDPATGRVPTVLIDACYDVSGVDVVDPAGASVVLPDRPDRAWVRLSVSNYSWDTDPENAWRVSVTQDQREQEPCEPAA